MLSVSGAATSHVEPYTRGVVTTWVRLDANTRPAVAPKTPSAAPMIADRTGTAVRPRPRSSAMRSPLVTVGARPAAAAIAEARGSTVDALNLQIAQQPDGPFARAGLAIESWSVDDVSQFAVGLRRSRERDAAAGRTLSGPHRQDLAVTHLAKAQPAARASTGEQKALLIRLVLAHAGLIKDMTGFAPILLLDEIVAHLDPARRAALYDALASLGAQVWMTGADPAAFGDIVGRAQVFEVRAGTVEPRR